MDPVLDQKSEGDKGPGAIEADKRPAGQGGGLHRDLPLESGESKAGFMRYIDGAQSACPERRNIAFANRGSAA